MEKLSLEEKIGQMLIITLKEKKITNKTIEFIQKYKIGGIILYKDNYSSYQEMIDLINELKEINSVNEIPIFITIDQEGGRVNRMPPEILNIKNASAIASTKDIMKVRKSANIIGRMLKSIGVSVNFAPVLDIKRFADKHAIGDRCYGENKEDVSKYGIEFMNELSKQGVLPVIKHFPGHGATTKDSHFNLPYVNIDKEILEKEDMYPFEKAIENGAEAIMVGHIVIKDIDSKYPTSLSKKIINDYLKEKNKFNGLIITDDLKMLAIRLRYSMSKAVELAINAGNNMVMIGLSYEEIEKVIHNTAKKVEKGKISEKSINESVDKIIKMKQKYNVNDEPISGIDIKKINEEIEELNTKIESFSK